MKTIIQSRFPIVCLNLTQFALLFSFCLILTSSALGTVQLPNRFLFQGDEYATDADPLEDYFQKYPERKPKIQGTSSDLWRGYLATFEIADDALILKDVEINIGFRQKDDGLYYRSWKSVLSDVVPAKTKLKIDWFTGLLVLGYGERIFEEYDFFKVFEKYVILEVSEGNFRSHRKFDRKAFAEFRNRQFEAYKKTEEYRNRVKLLREDGRKYDDIDPIIRDMIISYTKKFLID